MASGAGWAGVKLALDYREPSVILQRWEEGILLATFA